jgi:predicted dehydrogenase
MTLIGTHTRKGPFPGWFTAFQMHANGENAFTILRHEFTPANQNPNPTEWEYRMDSGVARWISNDQTIPLDAVSTFFITETPGFDLDKHTTAYHRELSEFLTAYRTMQPPTPTAEERYEARAAFGPGKVVVNVVTGRKYTT